MLSGTALHKYFNGSVFDLQAEEVQALYLRVAVFFTLVTIVGRALLVRPPRVGEKIKLKPRKGAVKEDRLPAVPLVAEVIVFNKQEKKFRINGEEKDYKEINSQYSIQTDGRKRLSWVIGMVNGFVTFLAALYHFQSVIVLHPGILTLQADPALLLHGRTNLSFSTAVIFQVGTAADLVFGTLFYREHIQLLTGWFHHALFIWVMHYVNHVQPYFANTIILALLQELPTFILALGTVFPALRADLLFGSTFFLFRICFNAIIYYYAYFALDRAMFAVITTSMLMHLMWFKNWFVGQFVTKKYSKRD